MANKYVHQAHCEYIFRNEMQALDLNNEECRQDISDIIDERLDKIARAYPGFDINSHSLTLIGNVLLLTVFLHQSVEDYLS